MTVRALFDDALRAAKAWHMALPALNQFCPWPERLIYQERLPHLLPATTLMQSAPGQESDQSAPLLSALQALAPYLEWRHTYTVDEVGQHFLDTFGWFELAGPTGHFITDETRITVGYWGPSLRYERHQHVAEELYTVVSGEAQFMSDGEPDEILRAEGTRFHASNQPHALQTLASPLLVLVFWRGDGLCDPPAMSPS